MTWSLIASTTKDWSGTPQNSTGMNTTGAKLLAITMVGYEGESINPCSVSDSYSNTWTALTNQRGCAETYEQIFYCIAPVVGAGHTFTGTAKYGGIIIHAWGTDAASVSYDRQAGANSNCSSVSSIQPGSVTPAANGALLLTGICLDNGSSGTPTCSGFTVAGQFPEVSDSHKGGAMAYLAQTTATATNPTWAPGAGSSRLGTSIAVFLESGGASLVVNPLSGRGGSAAQPLVN